MRTAAIPQPAHTKKSDGWAVGSEVSSPEDIAIVPRCGLVLVLGLEANRRTRPRLPPAGSPQPGLPVHNAQACTLRNSALRGWVAHAASCFRAARVATGPHPQALPRSRQWKMARSQRPSMDKLARQTAVDKVHCPAPHKKAAPADTRGYLNHRWNQTPETARALASNALCSVHPTSTSTSMWEMLRKPSPVTHEMSAARPLLHSTSNEEALSGMPWLAPDRSRARQSGLGACDANPTRGTH